MYSSKLWLFGTRLVYLILITGAHGWGTDGHYATCKIAEEFLSREAEEAVARLLPASAGGSLAEVCSWADDVRRQYRWSSSLHFADTPDYVCSYNQTRDCHNSIEEKGRCIVAAIYNYSTQLSDGYQNSFESKYNLSEALMFLSHFLGDVHQPLHIGFLGDLGGNTILVQWYGTKTNLHRVWDYEIIETAMETFYDNQLLFMTRTILQYTKNNWSSGPSSWGICPDNQSPCPESYASESSTLACKFAYPDARNESSLGEAYFLTRLPVIEERLAQGGVRLAAILNRIFASPPKIAQQ